MDPGWGVVVVVVAAGWACNTHSCWRSSRGLGSGVRRGVVHYVSSGTAADYLPPCQIHAHPCAGPASAASSSSPSAAVAAHAVGGDHGGHLRRAALRVEVAPPAVLAVQLRFRVRVGSSVGGGGGEKNKNKKQHHHPDQNLLVHVCPPTPAIMCS